MGWFPGDLRHDGTKYVIDDAALADSMALEMENQLKDLYEKLKGAALPDIGIDERRLLFLATVTTA